MTAKNVAKQRVKAGQSKSAAADRRALFVEAFLSNGENALQAAISAGFSPKTSGSQGSRLLKNVEVLTLIDSRRAQVLAGAELTTGRLFKGIANIAFSDPRRIMHADGRIKRPNELDDETAAALASFEVAADGSIKYKFWDKNSAHERAGKILGVFEQDNRQGGAGIAEAVQLIINGVKPNA